MSMDEVKDVSSDSSTEEAVLTETEETPEKETPVEEETLEPEKSKYVPFDRFEKVNKELQALKKRPPQVIDKSLDVEDYIDISASLEGLDQREKSFLAREHKLSGKSLREIRESEDFQIWQSGYRAKVERENSLKPSTKQDEVSRPKSLRDKVVSAPSLKDKETILTEMGLYKPPHRKHDRSKIA